MAISEKCSEPLSAEEFSAVMAVIGFFETSPVIALGISGGTDSMALVLLLDEWARQRGGRVIGLSVDHGLRPESGDEARQTGRWLHARSIEHHILPWAGKKPTSAIQAKARLARRNLLLNWCREAGVLHLALAHHADDQAETYMMRLAKGSGPDGLAGMSAVYEFPQGRIIRPLLNVNKDRLVATLQTRKQDWIEDPSNAMEQFERVRVRRSLATMEDVGANSQRIAQVMKEYAQSRQELDEHSTSVLARCVHLHGAGFARLNADALCAQGDVLGARVLGRLLFVIGGREYGAQKDKLHRAYEVLKSGKLGRGITLAGCRIVATRDGYLVCRENRNLPPGIVVNTGDDLYWDHRFTMKASRETVDGVTCTLAALGGRGWQEIVEQKSDLRDCKVPLIARYALPALYCGGHVVQVPHLAFDACRQRYSAFRIARIDFLPREPVLGACFVP